ncbi:MAG TPA: hypothetical protein VKF59_13410 [Candidatus Dormibacteraeota bacterium]|nr:hypothetical protein [Candidatus Dormibacteraeota bacterium]
MSDTPRTAFTLVLAAVAGLGIVVNAASTPATGQALAPLLTLPAYGAGRGQFPPHRSIGVLRPVAPPIGDADAS